MERNNRYGADDIIVLPAFEAIRLRPAMYVGGTDSRGLQSTFLAVSDNSIEEAMAGRCDCIEVAFHADGSLSVTDNGPGIPVETVKATLPELRVPVIEHLLTMLHAGSPRKLFTSFMGPNSAERAKYPYRTCGGMHGLHLVVVNALSARLRCEVRNAKGRFQISFARGHTVQPLERVSGPDGTSGTFVRWLPDPEIFEGAAFDPMLIRNRLRELAFLNPEVKLSFKDCRDRQNEDQPESFVSLGGTVGFVRYLSAPSEPISPIVSFRKTEGAVIVDGALQYVRERGTRLFCYANMVRTREGTHEAALMSAITRCLNKHGAAARDHNSLACCPDSLRGSHLRKGLVASLSVKVPDPVYTSATRMRLENQEVYGPVFRAVYSALDSIFAANPVVARDITFHARFG